MPPTRAWQENRKIPTYPLPDPDSYPMFFEKRVYQGSSGKVYPLAFYSRLCDEVQDIGWDMWCLENEYVRLEVLPQLGGRIWRGLDLTNNYDFFYHQPVIKPALVGLAGPWISGGVEFNWPQHHRPATYLPVDVSLEEHDDGSRTIWMSDHDPMVHMKAMHGVCVRPGSSVVELKVRLYNRTPYVHTFLWWANVAALVHDQYQSFFPPDVRYVADHAVRAMSRFPIADNHYYGVDYRPGTDLSWYRNIPVPTSYMITKTAHDFFGGYDHRAGGGFVHVANRHISPGKKQWTWGNHDFGWAWDRELTEADEQGVYPPYVELMAGVYTDNQPDFSYLMPYETRTFTQVWWPYQQIGPLHNANREFGVNLTVADGRARIGICASGKQDQVAWRLRRGDRVIEQAEASLSPSQPRQAEIAVPDGITPHELTVEVWVGDQVQLAYTPPAPPVDDVIPPSATEPPVPGDIESNDELYLTGEHLEQYRHPTRNPDDYWLEALRRDPGDARAHSALGQRLLKRGMLEDAVEHLRAAVQRNTRRHPNPQDGEPVYFLGLCLKLQGKWDEAYRWLYKATWNYAWRSAGYYQLATIDVRRGQIDLALEHLRESMQTNARFNNGRTLQATLLRRAGDSAAAAALCEQVLAEDALDALAQWEWSQCGHGQTPALRPEITLDLVFDLANAGLVDEAIAAMGEPTDGQPLIHHYTRCWLIGQQQGDDAARAALRSAGACDCRWCFPDRWEEAVVLRYVIEIDSADAQACVALGAMHYDKRNYPLAIEAWNQALQRDPNHVGALRNLAIATMNVQHRPDKALEFLAKAHEIAPNDAQILSEYDQLLKRTGGPIDQRLERLEANAAIVAQRDDLTVEHTALLNLTGQHEGAAKAMGARRFHPWEGGEGKAMSQHVAAHLGLARQAMANGDYAMAVGHAQMAMSSPERLGEAKHLLANVADILFHRGAAKMQAGDTTGGREDLQAAAAFEGDFLDMAVQSYSDKSFYSGMAMRWLGQKSQAAEHFQAMLSFGNELIATPAKIDYFATSLPDLLVFEDNLQKRREIEGTVILALANVGLGKTDAAVQALQKVVAADPAQPVAQMMLAESSRPASLLWSTHPPVAQV